MFQWLKWTSTLYVSVIRWSWLLLQTGTSHKMPTLFSLFWLSINYITKGHYILDTWHIPLSGFLSVLEVGFFSGTKKNLVFGVLSLFPAYHREVAGTLFFPLHSRLCGQFIKALNEMHHQGGTVLVTKVSYAHLSLNFKCVIRVTH